MSAQIARMENRSRRTLKESSRRCFRSLLADFLCLWILVTIVAGQALASNLPRITAQAKVSVIGERVTLGTLFTPQRLDTRLAEQLDATLVTLSPAPGQSKTLAAAEILRRLETIRITSENYSIELPSEIVILRQHQTITAVDIAQRVTREFISRLPWKDAQLEKIEVAGSLLLPIGETEWLFSCSPNTDYAKPFYLNINFSIHGEVVKRAFLRTVLSIHETVPVSVKELKVSQPVQPGDIQWEKQRLLSTVNALVKEVQFFQTCRPRLTIPPGRVLTENLFMAMPLVKRGDSVLLVFENQQMRLTTQGKSLATGFRGQRIRVENPDSGKVLLAEVVDQGTAKVVF